ncbi:ABC-F family ATP-binding cassette domain-containing protein [Rhodococcus ruber]|uniref:ABC-F family ATP-binding cassette domain-containing protein n=1 Tax=Rhodococcus ruber TaxID=1830 RepID=A0ABT4MAM3_9NOCA|nr:ABC-F family ATP-binding cassette domain-containing protein [Rhodococcus ruber]MCZ4518007.1 ABC-F family ATP-binding cassette domain-containing protein [Rhodococcus ruber]
MPHSAVVSARSDAQLIASNITVTFGASTVLSGVDIAVTAASRWAIVGENGQGKSTLLKVLADRLTPDSGCMSCVGTVGVAEQEMVTTDERTVGEVLRESVADSILALANLDAAAEDLATGVKGAEQSYSIAFERVESLDAWDAERRVDIALDGLGAVSDRSRLLTELSVGQRYRVRLACLLGGNHDFLLLDEPTNHLDRAGLDYLTARLRARAGGVVVVSHDRALISDVAQQILDLDPTPDGRPRVYGDGYDSYRAGRAAELVRWEQEHRLQLAETARLREDLSKAQNRLVGSWRPDKGTNKHQRATRAGGLVRNVHRRQEDLESQLLPVPEPPQRLRFPSIDARSGAALLIADRVEVEGRLNGPVSLNLEAGGKQVVTGPNGTGKSTLLAVLAGELDPTAGHVHISDAARVVLLRQESALPPECSAGQYFRSCSGTTVSLSSLGLLRSRETSKRIGELSMGQQRRLELALALARRPHVLLLDEPTNHLSIALVDELTEALHATDAGVVVSTHDRQMLRDLSDWNAVDLGGER